MNNETPGKGIPFYQNILDKRSRRVKPPKGDKAAVTAGSERGRSDGHARTDRADRTGRAGRMDREHAGPRGHHGSGPSGDRRPAPAFTPPKPAGTPVFAPLSAETHRLLDAFPDIVQGVLPLDSRRLQELPKTVRTLSHSLTDERSTRRTGYMNDPAVLSAYIRYYQWWNLVRLCRLFTNLPLDLRSGDVCADFGSGPLTVPLALWISRPELRALNLTWYCLDISASSLAAGEELFLSLCARTGGSPWKIVRIKGEFGAPVRQKLRFAVSANMFNELFWDSPQPLEELTKHHAAALAGFLEEGRAAVLLVEPGISRAGRFVSLLRDALARRGFDPSSPCPHQAACPFPGLRNGKWCHFAFDTADAPRSLHKLSEAAHLSKDRAALSYIYACRSGEDSSLEQTLSGSPSTVAVKNPANTDGSTSVRVVSDAIRLPHGRIGRYCCSDRGMVLLSAGRGGYDWVAGLASGAAVSIPEARKNGSEERDEKTGALVLRI